MRVMKRQFDKTKKSRIAQVLSFKRFFLNLNKRVIKIIKVWKYWLRSEEPYLIIEPSKIETNWGLSRKMNFNVRISKNI